MSHDTRLFGDDSAGDEAGGSGLADRAWNLHRLRIFWTVARQLSYTRAAEQLSIAQPALSHQVRALQAELGTELFARRGRGIELTPAGRVLADVCTDVFRRLEEGAQMLGEVEEGSRGSVDIAADTTSGTYVVPAALGTFHRQHPGIEITLHVENRSGVIGRLADRSCDIAVMANPAVELGVEVAPFLLDRLVVVAAPDHPLAARSSISLATIAGERFLVREPGSGTRAATERIFARDGRRIRPVMELGSSGAIEQAVAAGLGIAVVSRWSIDLDLSAGRLVVLDVQGFPLERRWSLVNLRDRRLSAAAQLCLAFLADHAATQDRGAPTIDRNVATVG